MAENDEKLGLSAEQKSVIKELSPMEQFAFYQGIARGVLMVMNTLMIKHAGCTLQQYQKRMIKNKITGIVPVQEELDMLAALVIESQHLVDIFRDKALNQPTNQKEPANDDAKDKQ